METAPVKTREQLHQEWVHRPYEEKHLSFAEWQQERESPLKEAAHRCAVAADFQPPTSRPQHETTKMNNLETKYAAHLELRKTTGEIVEWRFEPMKLRLAPRTYFDIDFLVITPDDYGKHGPIELHEAKGHWEDDARVKMKVAATMFPWWRFVGVKWDKGTKDWKFEEFRA